MHLEANIWRGAPKGFPRGEAVTKSGSSQPILVTEEECGRKLQMVVSVRTSSDS